MEIYFKRFLVNFNKNLEKFNILKYFTIDFHSFSSKNLCWGDVLLVLPPPGAATDNAARYTVTSSPVPSTERNISLDFGDVFNDFVSRKARKFQLLIYINNCLMGSATYKNWGAQVTT